MNNLAYHSALKMVKELIYDRFGLELTNLKLNSESVEYGACSFELDEKKMEHRVSKITLTKVGQFVTIWKRNKDGETEPFDILDNFDFIAITSKSADNIGQFIFPKSVLVEKGIISKNGKGGKRGIRVYPPWDTVTNKQAEKTQSWQTNYFVTISNDSATDFDLIRKIVDRTNGLKPKTRQSRITDMKSKILLTILVVCLLTSCKKDYTCSCSNPGGVFQTYKIKDTKKKAIQKCSDYSKEYQTMEWSETGCFLN